MNKDLPAKQRTMINFLQNLKKLLVGWKFEKGNFNDPTGILTIAGIAILHVEVDTFDFKLNWLDQSWKQWEDLTQDPKFLELIKIAEDKLAKAKAFANQKGKGNGPRIGKTAARGPCITPPHKRWGDEGLHTWLP